MRLNFNLYTTTLSKNITCLTIYRKHFSSYLKDKYTEHCSNDKKCLSNWKYKNYFWVNHEKLRRSMNNSRNAIIIYRVSLEDLPITISPEIIHLS